MKVFKAAAMALALAGVLAGPAAGQGMAERVAAAEALYAESMAGQMARQMSAALLPAMRAQLQRAAKAQGKRLNPNATERLEAMVAEVMDETIEAQRPIVVEELARALTLAEIEALREFYARPEFASIMAKMPAVIERISLRAVEMSPDIQRKLAERMPKDLMVE